MITFGGEIEERDGEVFLKLQIKDGSLTTERERDLFWEDLSGLADELLDSDGNYLLLGGGF